MTMTPFLNAKMRMEETSRNRKRTHLEENSMREDNKRKRFDSSGLKSETAKPQSPEMSHPSSRQLSSVLNEKMLEQGQAEVSTLCTIC